MRLFSETQNTELQSYRPDAVAGTPAVEAREPLDNDADVRMIVGSLEEGAVIRVIEARSRKYVFVEDTVLALKAEGCTVKCHYRDVRQNEYAG